MNKCSKSVPAVYKLALDPCTDVKVVHIIWITLKNGLGNLNLIVCYLKITQWLKGLWNFRKFDLISSFNLYKTSLDCCKDTSIS